MTDSKSPPASGVVTLSDAAVVEGALAQAGLLLLDVWATWCGPCRLMAPVMDWAATQYGDTLRVAKLDADQNPQTVDQFQVRGLPTLILFRDGEEVARHEGAIPQAQLQDFLAPFL